MLKVQAKVRWILEGKDGTSATVQTFLTRFLILAINICCGMLTARSLGASGRGEQAAMLMWSQILGGSLTFGLPWSLIFNLKRSPNRRSEYIAAAIIISIASGFLAIATGIIVIPIALKSYDLQTIRTAQWLMLAALPGLVSLTINAAFDAEGQFSFSNRSRYFLPAVTFLMLIGFSTSNLLTPATAALSYALPALPISLWAFWRLQQDYRPCWMPSFFYYKSLFNYGLRAYGADLLSTLSSQLSQVAIVSLIAPSAMGLYTIAFSFSRMLNVVQVSIATVLFPKTSACSLSENLDRTAQAIRISLILMLPLSLFLGAFGEWILGFIYGAEFSQAIHIFHILLVEMIFVGVSLLLSQSYMSAGKPGFITTTQIIGMLVGVPLTVIFTYHYGAIGAALATLFSTTIKMIWLWLGFASLLKTAFPRLWFQRSDFTLLQRIFFHN